MPFIAWDQSGHIVQMNRAACEGTGQDQTKVIGAHLSVIFPDTPSKMVQARIQKLMKGENVVGVEIPFLKGDEERIGLWNAVMVNDVESHGRFCGAIWLDISERIRMENIVLESNMELQTALMRSNEARKQRVEFLAGMSHELRTPLSAIIGFSELMLDETHGDLTHEQKEFLKDIFKSGKALLSIINDMLDITKIQAGSLELSKIQISVNEEVMKVIKAMRDQYHHKGMELEVEIPDDLSDIEADPSRFRQMITNILDNSIKFTPQGGQIRISAENGTGQSLGKVLIHISDTGPGIPAQLKDAIFKEFIQLGDALTEKPKGTGLGLPLTRRLMELHEGEIGIESEEGKGTTITLEFPSLVPLETFAATDGERPVILVIDDNVQNQKLFSTVLNDAGYDVLIAQNGKEGVRKAISLKPFAILLDIMLPKMSGWDVLKVLKEHDTTSNIPVIIVSIVEDQEKGISLGAIDNFTKPIDRTKLLSRLAMLRPVLDGENLNVLVVDDDFSMVKLITEIMENEGHKVTGVFDGKSCIESVQNDPPDIILLDLMLPDISGFEVVSILKSDPDSRRIPIMVITGKDLTPEEVDKLNDDIISITLKEDFNQRGLLDELEFLCKVLKTQRRG